jgi:hypothetical protein
VGLANERTERFAVFKAIRENIESRGVLLKSQIGLNKKKKKKKRWGFISFGPVVSAGNKSSTSSNGKTVSAPFTIPGKSSSNYEAFRHPLCP